MRRRQTGSASRKISRPMPSRTIITPWHCGSVTVVHRHRTLRIAPRLCCRGRGNRSPIRLRISSTGRFVFCARRLAGCPCRLRESGRSESFQQPDSLPPWLDLQAHGGRGESAARIRSSTRNWKRRKPIKSNDNGGSFGNSSSFSKTAPEGPKQVAVSETSGARASRRSRFRHPPAESVR